MQRRASSRTRCRSPERTRGSARSWYAALGTRPFCIVSTASVAAALLLPAPARALVGATRLEEGAWPTVVRLDRGCTGVPVGTYQVLTAGHCAHGVTTANFGPPHAKRVSVLRCTAHPEATPGGAFDLAVCELSERAPVAPSVLQPTRGVSREFAMPGSQVVVVGYGETASEADGVKRELRTEIVHRSPRLVIGGRGGSICAGDSGAPAFVRAALSPSMQGGPGSRRAGFDAGDALVSRGQVGSGNDAGHEWRLLGIASATASPFCDGSPGIFAVPEYTHAWLRTFPGLTVIPCTALPACIESNEGGALAHHTEPVRGDRSAWVLLFMLAGVGAGVYARCRRVGRSTRRG